MPRRFANTQYGPFRLRALLRSALGPDERVIAWGAATEQVSASTALLHMALHFVPYIGFALSAATGLSPRRWFLLLTDQRILVLAVEERWLRQREPAPAMEWPVERVRVRVANLGTSYTLITDHAEALTFMIDPKQCRPAQRLCAALALMDPDRAAAAEDADDKTRAASADDFMPPSHISVPRQVRLGPARGRTWFT